MWKTERKRWDASHLRHPGTNDVGKRRKPCIFLFFYLVILFSKHSCCSGLHEGPHISQYALVWETAVRACLVWQWRSFTLNLTSQSFMTHRKKLSWFSLCKHLVRSCVFITPEMVPNLNIAFENWQKKNSKKKKKLWLMRWFFRCIHIKVHCKRLIEKMFLHLCTARHNVKK